MDDFGLQVLRHLYPDKGSSVGFIGFSLRQAPEEGDLKKRVAELMVAGYVREQYPRGGWIELTPAGRRVATTGREIRSRLERVPLEV
jgi:hypothetical protein